MKGEFEVEPGLGSERDELLKDQKIKTFLILDKSQQTKDYESSNINDSKSDGMVPVNEPTVILQQRRQSVVRWADKLPRLSLSKCMKECNQNVRLGYLVVMSPSRAGSSQSSS